MTGATRGWLSLGWLAVLSGCWFILTRRFANQQPAIVHRWLQLVIVGVITLIVRAVPALLLPSGAAFDTTSYAIVGSLIRTGHDIYTTPLAQGRHPYLPLQLYAYAAAHWLATTKGLPFAPLTKAPPIVADGIIAVTLTWLGQRRWDSWHLGLWYAFQPIAIYVSAYHGQFDAEPALAGLLAGLAIEAGHGTVAGLWLGLGILLKLWPAFFAPLLIWRLTRWQARATAAFSIAIVPLLGIACYRWLFPGSWSAVITPALSYAGVPGWWGYTALLRLSAVAAQHPIAAFLQPWQPAKRLAQAALFGRYGTLVALLLITLWLMWRRAPFLHAQLTLTLTFLATTAGFGVQYLVWPVPFALAAGYRRPLRAYTAACLILLLGANLLGLLQPQLHSFPLVRSDDTVRALGIPAWLVTLGWTVHCLRHRDHTAAKISR